MQDNINEIEAGSNGENSKYENKFIHMIFTTRKATFRQVFFNGNTITQAKEEKYLCIHLARTVYNKMNYNFYSKNTSRYLVIFSVILKPAVKQVNTFKLGLIVKNGNCTVTVDK